MSVAFWSVTIENGKSAVVQPPEGYVLNLIGAALDVSKSDKDSHVVLKASTESIEGERLNAVLATLRPKTADQVALGGR